MLKEFNRTYDNTEQFRTRFKRYFESTYDSNPISNDSKVFIELVNATNYINETEVWLLLKTENINITDNDLMLQDDSIFDDIFYDFDVYEFEFEDQLDDDVENRKFDIADGKTEMPALKDDQTDIKNQSLELNQDFVETFTENETSIAENIDSYDENYANEPENEECELNKANIALNFVASKRFLYMKEFFTLFNLIWRVL